VLMQQTFFAMRAVRHSIRYRRLHSSIRREIPIM
jgi:hypothetical protein